MPFGFGQHPRFPRHGDALARFDATGLWSSTADGATIAVQPIGPDADFPTPRAAARRYPNTCNTGWSGPASIVWRHEKTALPMTADAATGHPVVHVPTFDTETTCLGPRVDVRAAPVPGY